MLFDSQTVVFGLLTAKPCRIIWKLHQKLSFGPEKLEIRPPKVGTWRETLRENILFKCIFMKNNIFGLQTTFFDGFNVLMSFLAER